MTATVDRPVEEAPSGGKVPLVELKNVGKSYGNITALKDISLRVHAGEVTGILGDNGAGKSTLIKIIAGYHPQTDGELLVDGEAVDEVLGVDTSGLLRRDPLTYQAVIWITDPELGEVVGQPAS